MGYSLAEFMRDAKKGNMSLEITEWRGATGEDIIERLRGIRPVVYVKSKAVVLLNMNGEESTLNFDRAALTEYDKETLTVYNPALRELTEEERRELDKWRAIEKEYNEKNPYGDGGYYKKIAFFRESKFPYLNGWDKVAGKKYLQHEDKVFDENIRGDVGMKYKVHFA